MAWPSHRSTSSRVIAAVLSGLLSPLLRMSEKVVPGRRCTLPHHCADQSLNVPAVMWRPNRAIINCDPVLLAATAQRLRTELFGVVEMESVDQTPPRPLAVVYSYPSKPFTTMPWPA
jgi:hypothetical protein